MPTIREYQQSVSPTGPGAVINAPLSIADSSAAKGRVIGDALSQGAAIIHDIGERIDKSKVQLNTANARADLTIELQNDIDSGAAASPDFSQKFSEKVAKRMEKDSTGYYTGTGTQMAATSAGLLSAEFREQANHYQAVAVGQQALLSHKIAVDKDAITLQQDPQQLQSVLNGYLATVQDPNGNFAPRLPKQKLDELIQQTTETFGMAAMRGAINISPELAARNMKEGMGGAELLSADQRTQMLAEIDRGFRDRDIEDERRIRLQAREEQKAREVTMNDFQTKWDNKTLTIQEINTSNLLPHEKEHYKLLLKYGEDKEDPTVVNELFRRTHLPIGDPRKITTPEQLNPYFGRGVNFPALNNLKKEIDHDELGASMNEARKIAETAFTRTIIGRIQPDKAAIASMQWNMDFSAAFQKKIKDKEDPRDLITPGNKDNWLTPEKLRSYSMGPTAASAAEYDAQVSGAKEAEVEMAKPNHGKLPKITTVAEAQALPKGSFVVLVRPGLPDELMVK